MQEFVIATHNAHKLTEMRRILEPLGIAVQAADFRDVPETGKTFAENAYLKAKAACEQTGKPAIADDSGLMVDALSGAPGVYSARYAGEQASDAERMEKLLKELEPYPGREQRTARFVCAICCVFPQGDVLRWEGVCEGYIGFSPAGDHGFGYDPIFFLDTLSFAQIPKEEKDAVSHRGKALKGFVRLLREYQEKQETKESMDAYQ